MAGPGVLIYIESDSLAQRFASQLLPAAKLIQANDANHFVELFNTHPHAIGIMSVSPNKEYQAGEHPLWLAHSVSRQVPQAVVFAVGDSNLINRKLDLFTAGFAAVFTSFREIDRLRRAANRFWHDREPGLPVGLERQLSYPQNS
jgi:hypothetical protein